MNLHHEPKTYGDLKTTPISTGALPSLKKTQNHQPHDVESTSDESSSMPDRPVLVARVPSAVSSTGTSEWASADEGVNY